MRPPTRVTTPRLELREAWADDAAVLFPSYFGDAESARYLARAPHTTVQQTARFLDAWCRDAWAAAADRFAWVIARAETRAPIGIFLVIPSATQPRCVAVHYGLGRDQWGHGLATEAVRAAAEWLLGPGERHRLETVCDAEHRASMRVLEKAGFVRGALQPAALRLPAFGPGARDGYEYSREAPRL